MRGRVEEEEGDRARKRIMLTHACTYKKKKEPEHWPEISWVKVGRSSLRTNAKQGSQNASYGLGQEIINEKTLVSGACAS